MPTWALVNVGAAVLRVAAALMLYASGVSAESDPRPFPLWVYAALSFAFTAVGLALAVTHRSDRRAAWLGGVLALAGCPWARPLLDGPGGHPFVWLTYVRPETLAPAYMWAFVGAFPTDLTGRLGRAVKGISSASMVVGFAMFAVGLGALAGGTSRTGLLLNQLVNAPSGRVSPVWLLLFGLQLPALPFLFWRSWTARPAERQRVSIFIAGLLLGFGPIVLEVLVEGLWPRYGRFVHQPVAEPLVGAVLFGTLATVPFTTAYSVLFDRVVDVRIALHAAAQYFFARYVVGFLTLIPFGGLLLYLVRHREESLIALFDWGRRPVVLLGLALVGVVGLRVRPRLLRAIDQRYYREPYDARRIVSRLIGQTVPKSTAELGASVRQEVAHAFHADVEVFLVDDSQTVLQPVGSAIHPLSMMSPLLMMADADRPVVDVAARGSGSSFDGLPEFERQWLVNGDFRLLASIRSAVLGTVGLIAVGPKLSELRYGTEDLELLSSVGAAAGLAFDSLRLRAAPQEPMEPPARECDACGTVYPASSTACRCGRQLVESSVPHVLRGVYRFERRIGSGGTGVVYRAVDLSLGRNVAIKALNGTHTAQVGILIREARNMARVSHRHLAVIHSVERWQQTALLVQEFLERGTLAQALSTTAMPPDAVIELGLVLTDVLDELHRNGIVHCDIKPSNIGYASDGVVKLFDFGLARRVGFVPALASTSRPAPDTIDDLSDSLNRLAGTPYYMSPEAIRGAAPSPGFDLWALAVVLFEALSQRRPFDGQDVPEVLTAILFGKAPLIRDLRPELPQSASDFFAGAFDPDPRKRPATSLSFKAALKQVVFS